MENKNLWKSDYLESVADAAFLKCPSLTALGHGSSDVLLTEEEQANLSEKDAELFYKGYIAALKEIDNSLSMKSSTTKDATLSYVETLGNVMIFTWFSPLLNKTFTTSFSFDYNDVGIAVEDLYEYNYTRGQNEALAFYIPGSLLEEPSYSAFPRVDSFSSLHSFISGKGVKTFYYDMPYSEYLDIIKDIKPAQTVAPDALDGLSVIDFEKSGNQIIFYLGVIDKNNMPTGEDWHKPSYEFASRVYNEYIKGELRVSIPPEWCAMEPIDNCNSDACSKNALQEGKSACILLSPERVTNFWDALKYRETKKIFFGDSADSVLRIVEEVEKDAKRQQEEKAFILNSAVENLSEKGETA